MVHFILKSFGNYEESADTDGLNTARVENKTASVSATTTAPSANKTRGGGEMGTSDAPATTQSQEPTTSGVQATQPREEDD